jgi:hypothetical protein
METLISDYAVDALKEIATTIGKTTEEVFRIYVQGAKAEVFADIFYLGITSAAIVISYFYMPKLHKHVIEKNGDACDAAMTCLFATFGLLAAMFVIAMIGGDIIVRILAPEYVALHQLLETASGFIP